MIFDAVRNHLLPDMTRSHRKFTANVSLHGVFAVLVLLAALLAELLASS